MRKNHKTPALFVALVVLALISLFGLSPARAQGAVARAASAAASVAGSCVDARISSSMPTVSNWALACTRNAKNWQSSDVSLVDYDGNVVPKDAYNTAKIGWRVRIAPSLIRTQLVEVQPGGETLEHFCSRLLGNASTDVSSQCAKSTAVVNQLHGVRADAALPAGKLFVATRYVGAAIGKVLAAAPPKISTLTAAPKVAPRADRELASSPLGKMLEKMDSAANKLKVAKPPVVASAQAHSDETTGAPDASEDSQPTMSFFGWVQDVPRPVKYGAAILIFLGVGALAALQLRREGLLFTPRRRKSRGSLQVVEFLDDVVHQTAAPVAEFLDEVQAELNERKGRREDLPLVPAFLGIGRQTPAAQSAESEAHTGSVISIKDHRRRQVS